MKEAAAARNHFERRWEGYLQAVLFTPKAEAIAALKSHSGATIGGGEQIVVIEHTDDPRVLKGFVENTLLDVKLPFVLGV